MAKVATRQLFPQPNDGTESLVAQHTALFRSKTNLYGRVHLSSGLATSSSLHITRNGRPVAVWFGRIPAFDLNNSRELKRGMMARPRASYQSEDIARLVRQAAHRAATRRPRKRKAGGRRVAGENPALGAGRVKRRCGVIQT